MIVVILSLKHFNALNCSAKKNIVHTSVTGCPLLPVSSRPLRSGLQCNPLTPRIPSTPLPDDNYNVNQASVSRISWTITALCGQPSGTQKHRHSPWTFHCELNVAGQKPKQIHTC